MFKFCCRMPIVTSCVEDAHAKRMIEPSGAKNDKSLVLYIEYWLFICFKSQKIHHQNQVHHQSSQ